jgi:autotransporter-associated beta strand protein
VLAITNGNALGSGGVNPDSATELRGVGTFTLANQITIPALAFVTVSSTGTLTLQNLNMGTDSEVIFGSPGNAGSVTFASNAIETTSTSEFIDVAFGTLRNAGPLSALTTKAVQTSVEKGATLSLNDINLEVKNLTGSGSLTLGTKPLTTLFIDGGGFQGVISGAGRIDAAAAGGGTVTLTGANTYTGATFIDGGILSIGGGSGTGSVAGNIVNNAALEFDRSNAYTFGGVISGPGTVSIIGTGVITLTGNNTYGGVTLVNSGVLAINNNNALGPNSVTLSSGAELRATGTVTLLNEIIFPNAGGAAISTSGTFTLSNLDTASNVTFGSPGNSGTIVITNPIGVVAASTTITVTSGTLRNGGGLGGYTMGAGDTTVLAGATLSVNDQSIEIRDLLGSGSVTLGSKSLTVLTVGRGNFGGVISGAGALHSGPGVVVLAGKSALVGRADRLLEMWWTTASWTLTGATR